MSQRPGAAVASRARGGLLSGAMALALLLATTAPASALPPSPYPGLAPRALTPPFLDAARICLPGAARPELASAAERVADGDLEGARRALARVADGEPEAAARDAELALAVLEARRSNDLNAARGLLEAALRDHAPGPARSCARLEQVRLVLGAGRIPEARAELARFDRGQREAAAPSAQRTTAAFYRAEVALQERRRDAAREGYAALLADADAGLALAAQLRLADLALGWPLPEPGPESRAGWKQVRGLLAEVREQRIDIAPWAPRAAELAIAAGRLGEAHRWLARAEGFDASGVPSIRKADVLVALERREDARVVLERVADSAVLRAARELAEVRRAAYDLDGESADERARRLREAARSAQPEVAALARDALASLLLAEGDLPGALSTLARLAHSGAFVDGVPGFRDTLDATLRAAAREELDCPRVLERLGGRRDLFVRLGGEPGPFLRLGDCFLELGMPEQALEIYRGLVRRFGTDPGTDLPLRVARASLAAGDLPVLRATLRAHFARRGSAREELTAEEVQWVWLRARLDQRDGRTKEVAEQLLELAAREDLEPRLRVDVERALVGLDGEVVTPERLGRALASSLGRPIPGVPAEERADAWLRLADLQRAQGRRGVARAAYGRALALLPAGARRDRARFAAAMLEPTADGAREALARAAAREQQDPWTRLARGEGRLIRLRAAVGGGEASP